MIILDTVNRKLRVVLSGARAANDCPVTVHYVDAPLYIPDSIGIFTNGITAIDIIPGLASPNTRHVKLITLVNSDTAIVTAQFIYNDNGTLYPIIAPIILQIGDTLFYTDGEGWRVIDKNGNLKGAGVAGPTGGIGLTGPQGAAISGPQGLKGDWGLQGPPGIAGSQGIQGNPGNAGSPGAGIIHLDGKKGDMGFPGPPGLGLQGIQGIQGVAGKDGSTILSLDGKPGAMGFPIPGPQGNSGTPGTSGAQGSPGAGIIHLDGKQGLMGFPGPPGINGIQGIQGIQGINGSNVPAMSLALDGRIGAIGFPGPPGPIDGVKISGLPAATGWLDADEFPVNEAGTTKKLTGTLTKAYIGNTIINQAIADQAIGASVTAYITNSNLAVPVGKLRIGSWFRWKVWISKTAAGTIALIFLVKIGTLGTTGDTTLFTFTHGVGTAAIDTGWYDVVVICRGPLSASGLFQLEMQFDHNLATTGLNNVQRQIQETLSATFDVTTANLILGLAITTPALYALTCKALTAEAFNL